MTLIKSMGDSMFYNSELSYPYSIAVRENYTFLVDTEEYLKIKVYENK